MWIHSPLRILGEANGKQGYQHMEFLPQHLHRIPPENGNKATASHNYLPSPALEGTVHEMLSIQLQQTFEVDTRDFSCTGEAVKTDG